MSNARNLANIISGAYDIPSAALDNAVPADGSITAAKLASSLDLTGKSVTLPSGTGGKVLQVVMGSSDSVVLGSSNTWVSNPATVSITPSATSSKILLLHHSSYWGGNGNDVTFRFLKNSTPVGVATSGSYNLQGTTTDVMYDGNPWQTHNISMNYLDSPATTSAITYSVQGQIVLGVLTSNYFQWNATTTSSGNDSAHGISTIIAIEVGA